MIVTFSEHLDSLMRGAGMSKAELARRAGLSHVAVGNYLNGRVPRNPELGRLAAVFGLNPDYLLNPSKYSSPLLEAKAFASGVDGTQAEKDAAFNREAARLTRKLRTDDSLESNARILGPVDEIFVGTVPVISWAHAGTATSYEEIPTHWQERIPTMCRGERAFGLTIEGDSMTTQCQPGDIVTVDPDVEPRNGCLVVVKMKNDGVMLRRFNRIDSERVKLIAYNTLYPSTEHSLSEFHWIYPVHSTFRRELF